MALPVDITDPNMVNVEDQAYPPIPPTFQAPPPPHPAPPPPPPPLRGANTSPPPTSLASVSRGGRRKPAGSSPVFFSGLRDASRDRGRRSRRRNRPVRRRVLGPRGWKLSNKPDA